METETTFTDCRLNLPDHTAELANAEEAIEKFKTKLDTVKKTRNIDGKSHTRMYEEVARILDYVGRLSMPVFAIEDELEKRYVLDNKQSPALAKKLWLDHYDSLHHPYSLLKNRCFRLFEELDEEYIKIWKKFPPNWNP